MDLGRRDLRRGPIGREAANRAQLTIHRKADNEAANEMDVRVARGVDQDAKERQIVPTAQMRRRSRERRLDDIIEWHAKRSTISEKLDTISSPASYALALAND